MKYSHRLSDAVHILTYLEVYQGQPASSQDIAASVDANPSIIRRMIAKLAKAGILKPRSGNEAPKLTRSAAQISLLEIYRAVEENQHLLHVDEQTNQQCPVGGNIQPVLTQAFARVQKAAEAELACISLQSIVDGVKARINHD